MRGVMVPRASEANPLSPRCKTALRRICGVCRHFAGESLGAVGRCSLHHYAELRGMVSAADCDDFERPVVPPVVKGGADG